MDKKILKALLLVAGLMLAGSSPAKTGELDNELTANVLSTANSGLIADAGASPPEGSPQPVASSEAGAPSNSEAMAQTQSAVEAYMRKLTPAQCTLSFQNWSDFSTSGQTSAITLRYRVQKPAGDDVFAAVRFTLEGGSVAKSQVIQTGLDAAIIPAAQPQRPAVPISQPQPSPTPAGPAPVIDRFSGPIAAAKYGRKMTLRLNSAFSLAQLDQAKAKAQAEKKPLGFLMVWGPFFDHEADPQGKYSEEALVHFYEVFHKDLVLVFVRHETELGHVPPAVAKGFKGPDEGGYAPNMAVTDATCTEFIVEIPYRYLDGAGRAELFAKGGLKIDQWLANHPDAVPTPAPAASP